MTAAAGDLADPAAEAEARLSLAHLSMQYAPADVVEQCQRALDLPDVPVGAADPPAVLPVARPGPVRRRERGGEAGAGRRRKRREASDDHDNEVFTLVPRAAQALAGGDWRLALDLAAEAVARRHSVAGADGPAVAAGRVAGADLHRRRAASTRRSRSSTPG